MTDRVIIGSRGSKLALVQSRWVAAELGRLHPGLAVEIIEIKTTGDRNLDASLTEIGGKGAFTKELEDALLLGDCDLAVHSLKDLPTTLPDGLALACIPAREDTRDVVIAPRRAREGRHAALGFIPKGSTVGTSSLRRRAQLASLRPDLKVIEFRGNVDTRLRKLRDGEAFACILAAAGLRRLGLLDEALMTVDGMPAWWLDAPPWASDEGRDWLDPVDRGAKPGWLPAVGQGALGIETRADDRRLAALLAPLHDEITAAAVTSERALLNRLGAGCNAPVGALAIVDGDTLRLQGRTYGRGDDAGRSVDIEIAGPVEDARRLGGSCGGRLLDLT